MTKRTLPVSTYFSFSVGNTVVWKWAQWPHVMEAYSTTVTGASALPTTRSGRGPGFISSSTEISFGPAFLRCASAGSESPQAAIAESAAAPAAIFSAVAPGDASACPRGWTVDRSRVRSSPFGVTEPCAAISRRRVSINIGSGANKANWRERPFCRCSVRLRQTCRYRQSLRQVPDVSALQRPALTSAPSRASASRSPGSATCATSVVSGRALARGAGRANRSSMPTGACTMRSSATAA